MILPEILEAIFSLHLNLGSLLPLVLGATSALEALVTETRACQKFPMWAWVFVAETLDR